MLTRSLSLVSNGISIAAVAVACGGATDSGSSRGTLGSDAGSGGSSAGGGSNGGASSGSGGVRRGSGGSPNGGASMGGSPNGGSSVGGMSNGGASVGGSPSGGVAGVGQGGRAVGGIPNGGAAGSGASGGATNTGGVAGDGGPCQVCLSTYNLHWGQNGGLGAYVDTSRLGPCAAYSHERTPTFTDPVSLMCNDQISMCPGSPLEGIVASMASPAFQTAMQNHVLYGSDPRPVDGQVFRIGIGNDFIDVGPNCESDPSSCPNMPEPVARMVKLLRDLDRAMLAVDPCKTVFPPNPTP